MKIISDLNNETVKYAMDELSKYIRIMSDCTVMPEIQYASEIKNAKDTIRLSLLGNLNLDTFDLDDEFIDDIIDINVSHLSGYIAGSNPRSILMGVYEYLKSAGCRFIRPGADGEYIPQCDLTKHSFTYRKKADLAFRGECCEGAVSYEHMRDTVYWLPKVGMNMYMIEGIIPYYYMNRWYSHSANRIYSTGKFTEYEFLEPLVEKLEKDIKKVGLQLHAMGHGWMFEKLGIHSGSKEKQVASLKEEDKKYLALVNGERSLMHGETFYTHFCYSNPEARRMLVDICLSYVKKKPHIDFLHVWLADATNNQCECENCVKMTPSDHYVKLLNEIDEAFTAEGINTRIVFALYVDTERPPEKLQLNNPKRFAMLSAMGLHYEKGYTREIYDGEIPPFERNNFIPQKNSLRMLWYRKWKELCSDIPGFICEYRFYMDHYCDPGYMRVSREIHRDMTTLDEVKFHGSMNDQTPRVFMPTSLPVMLMGECMFNKNTDLEKFCDDYFYSAFGDDGMECRNYLEKLSDLFCPGNIRNGGGTSVEEEGLETKDDLPLTWRNNSEVAKKLSLIPSVLEEFVPVIKRNMSLDNPCHRRSWVILKYHHDICSYLWKIFYHGSMNEIQDAKEIIEALTVFLSKNEPYIHNELDVNLFLRNLRFKFE